MLQSADAASYCSRYIVYWSVYIIRSQVIYQDPHFFIGKVFSQVIYQHLHFFIGSASVVQDIAQDLQSLRNMAFGNNVLLLLLAHTVSDISFIGQLIFLMIIVQEGFSITCHILLQVLYQHPHLFIGWASLEQDIYQDLHSLRKACPQKYGIS